jgi:membrane-bound lytic murein transglycosylase D
MRKFILGMLVITAYSAANLSANTLIQDTIPSIRNDTVFTDLNFEENLDSLLGLYYVGQSMALDPEFWNNTPDSLFPDVSDSVYIERLKKIPTVVDLTYNAVVRRYIEVYTKTLWV